MESSRYKNKESYLENYKNFFPIHAESIELKGDELTVKNTFPRIHNFEVVNFGKDLEIKETINMEDMAEVIWATKYLGDYNITKYGKIGAWKIQVISQCPKRINEQLSKIVEMNLIVEQSITKI